MKTKLSFILLTSLLSASAYAAGTSVGTQSGAAINGTTAIPPQPRGVQGGVQEGTTENRNGSVDPTMDHTTMDHTTMDHTTTTTTTATDSKTSAQFQPAPEQTSADLKLTTKVQNELKSKVSSFNPDQYQIYSQNGEVTIQGQVQAKADSDKIEKAARKVKGVKKIDNQITVGSSTEPATGTGNY